MKERERNVKKRGNKGAKDGKKEKNGRIIFIIIIFCLIVFLMNFIL